jgi:hypothetical protein
VKHANCKTIPDINEPETFFIRATTFHSARANSEIRKKRRRNDVTDRGMTRFPNIRGHARSAPTILSSQWMPAVARLFTTKPRYTVLNHRVIRLPTIPEIVLTSHITKSSQSMVSTRRKPSTDIQEHEASVSGYDCCFC